MANKETKNENITLKAEFVIKKLWERYKNFDVNFQKEKYENQVKKECWDIFFEKGTKKNGNDLTSEMKSILDKVYNGKSSSWKAFMGKGTSSSFKRMKEKNELDSSAKELTTLLEDDGKFKYAKNGSINNAQRKLLLCRSIFDEKWKYHFKIIPQDYDSDQPFIYALFNEVLGDSNRIKDCSLDNEAIVMEKIYEWCNVSPVTLEDWIKIGSLLWYVTDYYWKYDNNPFLDIDRFETNRQIIFTGAPGTGKTYGIQEYVDIAIKSDPIDKEIVVKTGMDVKQSDFVQFHSSYDYSDFVEGLRPITLSGSKEPTFVRMDGRFKEFCRKVVEYNKLENEKSNGSDGSKRFYFIIDEINRADLGKVFGELMYSLEEEYRGSDKRVHTQYENLPSYCKKKNKVSPVGASDCFINGFFIPKNVYIIGSMNDIDRSVETFDFALRRRFLWKEIKANECLENNLGSMVGIPGLDLDDIKKRIIEMNQVISGESKTTPNGSQFRLNESYQIGPAYFKTYDGSDEELITNIWDKKIEPILREYCRGYDKRNTDSFIAKCKEKLGIAINEDLAVNIIAANKFLADLWNKNEKPAEVKNKNKPFIKLNDFMDVNVDDENTEKVINSIKSIMEKTYKAKIDSLINDYFSDEMLKTTKIDEVSFNDKKALAEEIYEKCCSILVEDGKLGEKLNSL